MRLAKAGLVLLFLFVILALVARAEFPTPYRQVVVRQSALSGVDPHLVFAVARAESHFRPDAVSRRGAVGIMQLMPATARWMASKMGQSLPKGALRDPHTNFILGIQYLAYLRQQFHGNRVLMLAAYNGGRTNVLRWQRQNGVNGSSASVLRIPFPETRQFVLRVLFYDKVYHLLYANLNTK